MAAKSSTPPDSGGPGDSFPHPRFAAHFTGAIYDPHDSANDEIAPFGTDEGDDLYVEWAERAEELETLSLRQMLELDNDTNVSNSGPTDLDDMVIAAGFIHLRATGWLDDEGMDWLRSALLRRDQAHPDLEFAALLHDLKTYDHKPPRVRKPPTPRRWIRILTGGGDSPLTNWCRQTERSLDADPGWRTWWTATPYDALDFYPHLTVVKDAVSLKEDGNRLVIIASARSVGRAAKRHLGRTVTADSPPLPSLMTLPNFNTQLDDLLLSALRTAARKRHLSPPPEQLP